MRTLSLACLALLAASALSAVEPVNTHCPMSGNPIDPALGTVPVTMGSGTSADIVNVGTCTKACATMLVAGGTKYRVQVLSTMKEQGRFPHIKGFEATEVLDACCNTTCPVDGKPVNPAVKPMQYRFSEKHSPKNPDAVQNAVLVGFCSDACMTTYAKNPATYEDALWLQNKNKRRDIK